MSSKTARRQEAKGWAWLAAGVALFIFVTTLVSVRLGVEGPSPAILLALGTVFFIVLRGPLRLRLFLRSRQQARAGRAWILLCVFLGAFWPGLTWGLTRLFVWLGL